MDSLRSRRIVRLAASQTRDYFTRKWLEWDEFGSWEALASVEIERLKARALELHMAEPQVDEEIANYLRYLALRSQLPND